MPYNAGGPRTYSPDLTTQDPRNMQSQNRTTAYDYMGRIDQDAMEEAMRRFGLEGGYRDKGDSAYDYLYQNPGYTQDELGNIIRQPQTEQYNLSPEQLNQLQLRPDEQAAIAGDPNKQRGWFNPAQTEGIAGEAAARAGGAIDTWGNNARGVWGNMAGNTRQAISSANLAPGQDYYSMQDGALGGTEDAVRGYTRDPNLGLSDEYKSRMNFTPQDEQSMVTAASTSIGNSTRALRDRVERNAAQSGYNSPMALSSALQQLQMQGDINAEDAALNAAIQAKRLGLDTAQMREDTRSAADRFRSTIGTQSEMNLGRNRLAAAGEREGFRSDAERARLNATLGNEADLGRSLMGAEAQLGQAGADAHFTAGNQKQQANQFNQTTGIGMERDIDQTQSSRAANTAGNRQDIGMGAQQQMWAQNQATNSALSNRHIGAGNARRADQQESRGWFGGQASEQSQLGQNVRGQRISNYGTGMGAADASAGQAAQYDLGRRNSGFTAAFKQRLGAGIADAMTGAGVQAAAKRGWA